MARKRSRSKGSSKSKRRNSRRSKSSKRKASTPRARKLMPEQEAALTLKRIRRNWLSGIPGSKSWKRRSPKPPRALRRQTAYVRRKAALKQQGEDERVEFSLLLAGCRNVKAARAVLGDHGGDVDALKAAEPWMFQDSPAKATGKTGLPNAGAASDKDAQVKKRRAIAGLDDEK